MLCNAHLDHLKKNYLIKKNFQMWYFIRTMWLEMLSLLSHRFFFRSLSVQFLNNKTVYLTMMTIFMYSSIQVPCNKTILKRFLFNTHLSFLLKNKKKKLKRCSNEVICLAHGYLSFFYLSAVAYEISAAYISSG